MLLRSPGIKTSTEVKKVIDDEGALGDSESVCSFEKDEKLTRS